MSARRIAAPLGVLFVLAALTGCTTTTIGAPEPVVTTSAPVFASDEEALAAAEEAYAAYTSMSDLIAREGGARAQRIEEVATGAVLENALETYQQFSDNGWKLIGQTTFDSMSLQRYDSDQIVAYLCADASGVDVVDGAGVSMVKPDRRTRVPFEATFEVTASRPVLSVRAVWTNGSTC